MAMKLKVTYVDGRIVEVIATPRAQVMTEQHFKGVGDANFLQSVYFLAWASLHRSGKEPTEYEPWLDLIEDVERIAQAALRADVQQVLAARQLEDTVEGKQMLELADLLDDRQEAMDPTRTGLSPGSSSNSASEPGSPSTPSPT